MLGKREPFKVQWHVLKLQKQVNMFFVSVFVSVFRSRKQEATTVPKRPKVSVLLNLVAVLKPYGLFQNLTCKSLFHAFRNQDPKFIYIFESLNRSKLNIDWKPKP